MDSAQMVLLMIDFFLRENGGGVDWQFVVGMGAFSDTPFSDIT